MLVPVTMPVALRGAAFGAGAAIALCLARACLGGLRPGRLVAIGGAAVACPVAASGLERLSGGVAVGHRAIMRTAHRATTGEVPDDPPSPLPPN